MKSDKIYQRLKNDMITGIFPAGTKLPGEEKLALEFGCARKTLRAALSKLEKEGRLERIRAHGTFIRPPKLSGDQKVISILIPYPDFISKNIFANSSIYHFFRFLGGAALAAVQKGWRLQTVPFSKTNDPADIDYESLECLQEDSRLLINSPWYQKAFKLFAQRKVRVGFAGDRIIDDMPYSKYLDQWVYGYTPLEKMKQKVIYYLYEKLHCRRAVCMAAALDFPAISMAEPYRKSCREVGMFYAEKTLTGTKNDYPGQVHEFCIKMNADVLLLQTGSFASPPTGMTFHEYFDLPDHVQIVSEDEEGAYHFNDYSIICGEPFDAGYILAQILQEDTYVPRKFELPGMWKKQESH